MLLEYHFLSTRTRNLRCSENTHTPKVAYSIFDCKSNRYLSEKEIAFSIEYPSTLSKNNASCRSALKCQLNFVLPRVMSKYVTRSVCSSFIVQVQAFNFLRCRTSASCFWSHTVTHCRMSVHVERFRNILKYST